MFCFAQSWDIYPAQTLKINITYIILYLFEKVCIKYFAEKLYFIELLTAAHAVCMLTIRCTIFILICTLLGELSNWKVGGEAVYS